MKLAGFGTAVAVSEMTSFQGLKGYTPHFAAPEVIRGEVPKCSADIWSVLCTLIQMLTARIPGCHQVKRNEMAMMYLVSVRLCATVLRICHAVCALCLYTIWLENLVVWRST